VLALKNINVSYGDLQALWDISLSIRGRSITALIGSNGAGKSTLQMTIAGLLRPMSGCIYLDDVRLDIQPANKIVEMGISMVPEGRRLFPEMTVLDNLEMGAYTASARKQIPRTLEWIYEIFPRLRERTGQRADTLSGGEQQMLAIARSLMSLPKIILLDELSLGLAPVVVQDFSKVLKEINQTEGITVFLVEQNVRMALELADYAYVLENGRISGEGEGSALLESQEVQEAYLGL
jgi:branched-chain amino acid transport system ATP-binding protein